MPRSVNAVASRARRKRILKQAKGFYGKRLSSTVGSEAWNSRDLKSRPH